MKHFINYSLKKYNSFGLNSIAKEIWFPESIEELQDTVKKLKNLEFEVLGGGTNVLLAPKIDRVICFKLMPKDLNFIPGGIDVSANYSTTGLIFLAMGEGIKGLEGLYGIPGTVGGAIVMNAGSGEYSISDYLVSVTILDISDGILYITDKKSLDFKRRYSILQDTKEIVVSALFNPKMGNIDCAKFKHIKNYRHNFPKGYSVGGIFKHWYMLKPYEKKIRQIYVPNLSVSKYLNVLISNGQATYDNIIEYINRVRKIVKEPLELEVKILGEK